ncbi:hypothetical protein M9H77_17639 [Catharanthus roseus]|uniref:Uncharacterized protein n=1 Tax=Catharanthus roseus TaxID=4058 RepID=A0ACC0B557_CATRO|nr:hypothetical protein M9H77_17639 [Catharanthus roseus]
MALIMRKFKRFYKKGFNNRGKKPPLKKGGQSSSLFKVTKRNKDLKSKTQYFLDENSRLICENKAILESLEVLKKEKECSNDDFQKLVLENKNLCEKISFLEKCLIDYDVLKKKVSDLTLCVEKFSKGKENFEKLLGSQRSPFDKNGQNPKEGGTSRGKGKGKRVPSGTGASAARVSERFISVKEAASFEEWTRNQRKIAPSHQVDLHDMQVDNVPHQWIVTRIGGSDIAFDDRLLNEILDTPQDGIRFYTKNKKCFDPNLYSEKRFAEIFTRGEVLKRHDDRNVNKLDAYGRVLHHMISNITIPNVGHKSSITNMHAFVMLALHKHRRMNFVYMAIEHMLATQSSSTKCLPYGCFITKILQHFVINLVGIGDHIGQGKIYTQQTFKRMGFEKDEDGTFIRGGQGDDDNDEEDDDEDEEDMGYGRRGQ